MRKLIKSCVISGVLASALMGAEAVSPELTAVDYYNMQNPNNPIVGPRSGRVVVPMNQQATQPQAAPVEQVAPVQKISNKKVVSSTVKKPDPQAQGYSGPVQPKTRDQQVGEKFGEQNLLSFPNAVTEKADLSSQATPIVSGAQEENLNDAIIGINSRSDLSKEKISKALDQKDDMEAFLARRNSEVKFNNRTIDYDYKAFETTPITIYLKKGYVSTIEFVDDMNEPVAVRQLNLGNKILNASQPAKNRISLEPISKYRTTNFNVELENRSGYITFKVIESEEGYENSFDNYLKLVVTDTEVNQGDTQTNIKVNILKELYKYGTLRNGAKAVAFDVMDTSKRADEVRYFDKADLKAFRVTKQGIKYLVVLLSQKYEMLGNVGGDFGRYSNTFDVYFLPFTKETFEIIKKTDIPSDPHSTPDSFESMIGFGEKYQIVLR